MSTETAVILAAGKGERMMPLTKNQPKCMVDFGGIPVITKVIYQLAFCGVKNIVVVVGYQKDTVISELRRIRGVNIDIIENDRFAEDTNILSLYLGINRITKSFILIEADTVFDDDLIAHLTSDIFDKKSVWFTNGLFNEQQYGGILKSDSEGNVLDIRIVTDFQEQYRGYQKLTGVMRVDERQIETFRALLKQYAANTIRQYYLVPWIQNLPSLPAIGADISAFSFATFNKMEEYQDIIRHRTFLSEYQSNGIHLISVDKLKHIEGFSSKKVENLTRKILQDGRWTRPICVEKNHWLVLDGQHRLEVAKHMGFKYIPSMLFNYCDVKFWSLRDNHEVSIGLVCEKALSGDIYPYKTVKHDFVIPIQPCDFRISELESFKDCKINGD